MQGVWSTEQDYNHFLLDCMYSNMHMGKLLPMDEGITEPLLPIQEVEL